MLRVVVVAAVALAGGTYGPFAWPTSVAVEPDGSVLVAENGSGRLDRVDPATGAVSTVASVPKAYDVVVARSGVVYLSANDRVYTVTGGRLVRVPGTGTGAGPIAVGSDGAVAYTTETTAVVVHDAKARVVAHGLAGPHGVAFARDGSVLVSDTGRNRVIRIRGTSVRPLIRVGQPRGLAVAPDGSLYVVEAVAKRVGHYTAAGRRLGTIGPRFGDPYALTIDGSSLLVVDTAASGVVRRVSR